MKFLNKLNKPYKILAPMVGNSDLAWRTLARTYGADICYSEMINCETFLRSNQNPKCNNWFTTNNLDRPLIVQICGNDSNKMLATAMMLQEHCDAIDINLGCPQEIARKGNYGAFLQDDWDTIKNIIGTLSLHLSVPVTCKIRIYDSIQKSVEYAKMIENAGAKMIAVHGRTREMRGVNTGLASWEHIREIKRNLNIPVISNGGIIHAENIQECLEYTKCDGVMIAETHLYNPLIFTNTKKTSLEIFKEYLDLFSTYTSKYDVKNIKSHAFKMFRVFLKQYPHFNESLNSCKTVDDYIVVYNIIKNFTAVNNIDSKYLQFAPNLRVAKQR